MTPHPPATAPARSERWRPWRRMDASRRLLARQLWSEKRFFTLTVVLSGAGAMFEGVGVGLLVPFLEGLMRPDKPPMQSGWAWFDTVVLAVQATPIDRLYRVALLILLSVWLRVILAYAASYTGGVMLQRILHRMRVQVFERLMSFSLRFFSKTRGGVLVNAMTNEVYRVNMLISTLSLALLNGSLALAYVAVLVVLSAKLALFTVFFCAGLYFGLNRILVRMRKQGTSLTETNDRLTWTITEALGGIRTINAAGSQRFETGRFTEASSASTDLSIRMNRSGAIVGPVTQGIASTGLIVMVVVAVQFFVLPGAMSVSALLGFLFGLFRLLPVVQQLNGGRAMWAVNRAGLDSVAELLRDDNKPFLHDGPRELTGLREGIRLENVSFGYEDDALVLRDVSVFFPHGKTTAIVGASGAGKSTLIDLAVRFYDPTEGRVLYDGVDVREFKKGSLRQRIAIVSQDTFVFNDTVRSNIAYGLADVPDARIREAAEQANAAGFIEEMEDGYETILGDRGTRLSGGQRQRLAIARAILRDPEILILDEATSALDSVSERQVQDALERLMRERTVVVIAHRLSTVEHADHVIVLEKGRVVEEGAYETLLEQRGQLWAYHSLQFQLT